MQSKKGTSYRIFCPEPLVSELTDFFNTERIDYEPPVEEAPEELGFDIISISSITIFTQIATPLIEKFAQKIHDLLKKNREYSLRIQTPTKTITFSSTQMPTYTKFLKALAELEG